MPYQKRILEIRISRWESSIKSLTIVGYFDEYLGPHDDGRESWNVLYGGLRNMSLIHGIADELSKYFDIRTLNIVDMPNIQRRPNGDFITPGISNVIKEYGVGQFYLYINCGRNYSIDLPINVIYLHIDGGMNISPNQSVFGIKFMTTDCTEDVHNHYLGILPFANMKAFNPSRHKNVFMSDISRDIPFVEYVNLLERSKYVIIRGDWFSKRSVEALACKTIPIILCDKKTMVYYKLAGFTTDFCHFIETDKWEDYDNIILTNYDPEMANKGYNFVKKHHSLERRGKQMRRAITKVLKGKYPHRDDIGNIVRY
jgi:hypothetical protein